MTEAYFQILSSKYPNWNFNTDPNHKVKLLVSCKFKFDGALLELLEILKNISVFYDNEDYVIKLKKGNIKKKIRSTIKCILRAALIFFIMVILIY